MSKVYGTPGGGVGVGPKVPKGGKEIKGPVTKLAKQQARARRRAKAQRRAKREAWQQLYDPTAMVSGAPLKAVANAMTELELKPGINAQKSAIAASRRGQRYDVGSLNRMGARLDTDMAGMVSRMGDYRNESISRADAAANDMNTRLAANTQQSQDRLNSLQGQVLGNQISTLTSQGITPGQSADDRALGQFAAGQQQAQANQAQSWASMAELLGQQGVTTAAAMGDAGIYGAEADRAAIKRNIGSRVADRQQMGAEERAKARSELATLRGLRGSSRLKNLLELRREQQDYGARRAEIAAQKQQWKAENARDWYDSVSGRIRANKTGNSSAGDGDGRGPNDTPRRMTNAEWKDWKSVAKEIVESAPDKKIVNWKEFLDTVGSSEGVSWKPRERAAFKKRIQQWYNQNY